MVLGICKLTGQYILHDDGQVRMVRTIMRVPDGNKWDAEKVEQVQCWPWQLHTKKAPGVIFKDNADKQPTPDIGGPVARRIALKKADFEASGYTSGCQRCDHDVRYGYGRTTARHTDACRDRIIAELRLTHSGAVRLAAADHRVNQYLADHIERHDKAMGEIAQQGEKDNGLLRKLTCLSRI